MDTPINEATVAGACPECETPYSRLAADAFTCECGWTEGEDSEADGEDKESAAPKPKPKSKAPARTKPAGKTADDDAKTAPGHKDERGDGKIGYAESAEDVKAEGEDKSPLVGDN